MRNGAGEVRAECPKHREPFMFGMEAEDAQSA